HLPLILLPRPSSPLFPTRRSSDLMLPTVVIGISVLFVYHAPPNERWIVIAQAVGCVAIPLVLELAGVVAPSYAVTDAGIAIIPRSEEHTSELQSLRHLVCRLLLEK